MRMMRRRSAGPLISKFLKRELARKRSKVSSIMSASSGLAVVSAGERCVVTEERRGDGLTLCSGSSDLGTDWQHGGVTHQSHIGILIKRRVISLTVSIGQDVRPIEG